MSEPTRHHYLPIFYTKAWTGADGHLCEYSRPWKETNAKRKHPSATGYVDGLYTMPDAKPGKEQVIEKGLMGHIDNWAAQAVADFLQNVPKPDARKIVGWVQFLYSLIVRTPEHLERIREKLGEVGPEVLDEIGDKYDKLKGPDDPPTLEEYKAKVAANPIKVPPQHVLPYLINSKRMAKELTSLIWTTRTVRTAKHALLTSDRPVVMTNGLRVDNAHIVVPISPRMLFIATKTQETSDFFKNQTSDELVYGINNKVAEQAVKYVYGVDDSQLRFVANRLGKKVPSTPID